MGYISYETDGGEVAEHSDIDVQYDTETQLFVFDVPGEDGSRHRYVPRERVFAIELDATVVEPEGEPSRGFGRMTG
jgi:hypothetical protein